jgi:hypothetical protein
MSLVFVNGFDDQMHSASQFGNYPPAFDTTRFRTGTTSMQIGTNNFNSYMILPIPGGGDATVVTGFAGFFQNLADIVCLLAMFMSDNAATAHVSVTMAPSTGVLNVYRGTPSGTLLGTTTLSGAAIATNTWGYWEIKCVLSDTVGEVHVRYNGSPVLDLTGVDTKNAGTKTIIDSVTYPQGSGFSNPAMNIDDFYLLTGTGTPNDFLGDCKVSTLYPNGDGSFSQLLGSDGDQVSNFALVNEVGAPVVSSYVESATPGQRDFYQMQDLALVANATILGVQVTGWCSNADGGAGRSAVLGVRQGVSEALSANQALTGATFLAARGVFAVDPGTGVAWNQAGVNSAQAGVQVA